MQIQAITLIVDDLTTSTDFYQRAFEVPIHFQDDESVVFDFGGLLVNLLAAEAAPELVDPLPVAPSSAGVHAQLTVPVDDVDAAATRLVSRGITILRGPEDRPWGVRTVSFCDPSGHLWELAR